MGGPYRRKKVLKAKKEFYRSCKTKNRTKDLDQIQLDLTVENVYSAKSIDPDLPGLGQFHCFACCKYFTQQNVLDLHMKTKNHKKRLRLLQEVPYTIAEAEAAAGMGNALVVERKPKLSNPPVLDVYGEVDQNEMKLE